MLSQRAWLAVFLLTASPAAAESFGFEITLHPAGASSADIAVAKLQEILADAAGGALCSPHKFTFEKRKTSVYEPPAFYMRFADGLALEWTVDKTVLEVKVHGAPDLAQLHQWLPRIQGCAFDVGERYGWKPAPWKGGGHEHLGAVSTFAGDVLLLRNFIVLHVNHPELGIVMRGGRSAQAMPICDTADEAHLLRRALREIDSLGYRAELFDDALFRLSQALFLNTEIIVHRVYGASAEDVGAYTVQLRSGAPFRNAQHLYLRAQFRMAVLAYVKEFKEPLPLALPAHSPTYAESLGLFAQFLAKLGLPSDPYMQLASFYGRPQPVDCGQFAIATAL